MIAGTKTYCLPNSDIVVDVEYRIFGESVVFDDASIDDNSLDCENLLVSVETTKPNDLVRTFEAIKLQEWFQLKLDNDAEEIFDENGIHVKSDFEEHFNQKDFV